MTENNSSKKIANEIFQWIEAIVLAIIIATVIRGFLFERVKVDGPSMDNTLAHGQNLITYKLGYFFQAPKRGDIIVFVHQEGTITGFIKNFIPFPIPGEKDYIKRTIGVPGDTIDIKDGSVYVNGEKLVEPYARGTTNNNNYFTYPIVVPSNKVFALGDNREHSSDSREFGYVDFKKIKGKAVYRIWPYNNIGKVF